MTTELMKGALTVMKRTVLLTTAMATALAGTGVTAAHAGTATAAAPGIVSISVQPSTVVLTGRGERKIKLTVVASGANRVRAQVNKAGHTGGMVSVLRPTGRPGVWTGWGSLNWVDDPGAYDLRVTAMDADSDTTEGHKRFQLRRGTYFGGFKAAPGVVRKGRAISVSGQLKGLNSVGRWAAYKRGHVAIYFRKAGTRAWVRYAVVTTDRNGRFLKKFKARATGDWKVQFGGNGTWYKSASKNRHVRVR
jgi:hypothetical protein